MASRIPLVDQLCHNFRSQGSNTTLLCNVGWRFCPNSRTPRVQERFSERQRRFSFVIAFARERKACLTDPDGVDGVNDAGVFLVRAFGFTYRPLRRMSVWVGLALLVVREFFTLCTGGFGLYGLPPTRTTYG